MGQIAQALGLGTDYTFDGETYRLAPWTYQIQGDYELYLQNEAVRTARRVGSMLPEDERKELLAQVSRDITSGVYSFGGDEVAKSLKAVPHLKYLFFLMLRKGSPDRGVTRELVDRMFEKEFEAALAKMSEANADPTTPAPGPALT